LGWPSPWSEQKKPCVQRLHSLLRPGAARGFCGAAASGDGWCCGHALCGGGGCAAAAAAAAVGGFSAVCWPRQHLRGRAGSGSGGGEAA
jgi:hypothetical protein